MFIFVIGQMSRNFMPGGNQCRQAGYRRPDDRRIDILAICIAICAIIDYRQTYLWWISIEIKLP